MASECTPENSNGRVVWETPWHEPWNTKGQYFSIWELIFSWHWSLGSTRDSGKYIFREGLMTSGFSGQLELHQKTSFREQGGLLNVYCLLLFEERRFWYFELGYSDSYGMEGYSFSMEWWIQKCPKREKWGPNPRCRANQWARSTESP